MANDLNLIPPPDLEKKKATNRKALWGGLIVVALILVGFFGVYTPLIEKAKLQRESELTSIDEARYQNLIKTHHDLAEMINAEKAKLLGLEGNLPEAFGWAVMLKDIEEVMPGPVHLKSMEFKERGLYILGIYKQNVNLSRLLVKLRGLEMIESAKLLSITYNREESGWEFEMLCDLPPSVYPQEPEPIIPDEGDAQGADTGSDAGAESQEGDTAS